MTVVRLDDGRALLPDNRWTLIDDSATTPEVSVVIPYYNQRRQLALVLEALTAQTYPRDRLEVVIADDGSDEPPDIEPWTPQLTIIVVAQEDAGFRAAAARNLGAAASHGSILCFLDCDTVPTPDYVRRAVQLPAEAPDTLVVGRRKHADLSGIATESVVRWMSENERLERAHAREPGWLVEAYDRTANLLAPGWDGYKYMISAVMTCSRTLFDDIGGFDPSFVQYGGEDWEVANRAFMMGAVFAHEPAAIAWHDGPDWAERSVPDRVSEKNTEALALAPLVTDPAARTSGLLYSIPDIVVLVSTGGHSAASLMQTIAGALRGVDSAVWLVGDDADALVDQLRVRDSRIRVGNPDSATLSRCRFVAEVSGRVIFSADTLGLLARELAPGEAGQVIVDFDASQAASVIISSSRARHRVRRWTGRTGLSDDELTRRLFGIRRLHPDRSGITVADADPSLSW